MRHPKGMNTYHAQEKDRQHWQRSIKYRKQLIDEAESLNIKLFEPYKMKIIDLERIINNHVEG